MLSSDLFDQCQVPQLGSCHNRGVGWGGSSHVQNRMESISIGHILSGADAISGVHVRELAWTGEEIYKIKRYFLANIKANYIEVNNYFAGTIKKIK